MCFLVLLASYVMVRVFSCLSVTLSYVDRGSQQTWSGETTFILLLMYLLFYERIER